MRLADTSDLHADFTGYTMTLPELHNDAWLLAGDIGCGV